MNEDERELHWSTTRRGDVESALPELDTALMKVLLEHIATRVAVVGPDRRYLYTNREALRFMGLPAEQVIGRPMSQVLDDGVYGVLAPLFDRVFGGESLHRRGWADYAKQGRRFREQWFVPYCPDPTAPTGRRCRRWWSAGSTIPSSAWASRNSRTSAASCAPAKR